MEKCHPSYPRVPLRSTRGNNPRPPPGPIRYQPRMGMSGHDAIENTTPVDRSSTTKVDVCFEDSLFAYSAYRIVDARERFEAAVEAHELPEEPEPSMSVSEVEINRTKS